MEVSPMSKFSLNSLASALAEKSSLSPMEAELFIRKMFEVANYGLQQDKQVKIKWLGTFKVTAIKDRESIDVNTGERILIEGRDKITFTPDNILKEIVNKPFSQFETIVVNDGVDFDCIDRKFEVSAPQEEGFAEEVTETSPENIDATTANDIPSETTDTVVSEEAINEPEETKPVFSTRISAAIASAAIAVEEVGKEEEKEIVEKEDEEEEEKEVVEEEKEEEKEEEPAETNGVIDVLESPSSKPQVSAENQSSEKAPTSEEISSANNTPAEVVAIPAQEDSEPTSAHHLVVPRYLAVIACLIIVALIGGMGWFAFNYGKMQAQRDHLETQLAYMQKAKTPAKPAVKPTKPAAISQDELILQKAKEDSARMAKASEAVKAAEQAEKEKTKEKTEKLAETTEKPIEKNKEEQAISTGKYNEDVRVRTGAYRIVGVAEVVTAGEGQSLTSISNRYLGTGMECYVEALNGIKEVKRGQKIKIPKLELKKRKNATNS